MEVNVTPNNFCKYRPPDSGDSSLIQQSSTLSEKRVLHGTFSGLGVVPSNEHLYVPLVCTVPSTQEGARSVLFKLKGHSSPITYFKGTLYPYIQVKIKSTY